LTIGLRDTKKKPRRIREISTDKAEEWTKKRGAAEFHRFLHLACIATWPQKTKGQTENCQRWQLYQHLLVIEKI